MNDKILKYLFYLYFPITLFEFALIGFGGSILKYYGIVVILLWLMIRAVDKKEIITSNVIVAFALWLVVSFISILWSSDKNTGIYYFFAAANMVTLSWVILNIDWQEKDIDTIKLLMELSGAVFSFLMIRKRNLYHGVGIRFTLSLFGNEIDPNNIAGLIIPSNLIALDFLLKRHGKKKCTIFHIVTFLSISIGIVMAGSRGGILALVIAISSYIMLDLYFSKDAGITLKDTRYYFEKPIRFSNIGYFILLIVSVAFLQYFIGSNIDQMLLNRISLKNILANNDAGSDRLYIWGSGLALYKEHILTGIGLGGFGGLTGKGMHNQYLRILVESGPLALFLFIYAILLIMLKLFRSKDELGLAIIIGMLVVIFFLDAFQKKYMWNPIILSMAFMKSQSFSMRQTRTVPQVEKR